METIERPNSAPRMTSIFDTPIASHDRPPRRWPYKLWRSAVASLTIAAVAFTLSGLMALRDQMATGWQSAFADFRWTVLVTGDQVELDEIGRYLKQLDGVDEATFLPSAAIMDRLKNEPLLADHLAVLDPSRLPSLWQISWTPALDLSIVDDTVEEIRRLPGVVDVSYERRELDKIRFFRSAWYRVRLVLSGAALLGAVLGSLLLGRFLFFTNLRLLRSNHVIEVVILGIFAWLAGLVMARELVGTFSWHLAWGGLAAGLARLCAAHTRRFE